MTGLKWWFLLEELSDNVYLPRIADAELERRLARSGAVVVRGPKWCGKTETALRQAKSVLYMQDPDEARSNVELAAEKPSVLLRGEKPRLIDEWQEAPQLWDAVRFSVDRERARGLYILTGSSTPKEKPKHSGVGRVSFLDMRPMTLFESRESTGEISLSALFSSPDDIEAKAMGDIESMAHCAVRGGWPGAVVDGDAQGSLEIASDYVRVVAEEDISRVDDVRRNPAHALLVMQAYARCSGVQADMASMSKSLKQQGSEISRPTFNAYVAALRKLLVLEDLPAWEPSMHAKSRVSTTPKRYFVDPSLAAAALGASPMLLLRDTSTFGGIFESMCIRDLRVYARWLKGSVYFYHDNTGLEADAVIVLPDGRWALVEVKLGTAQVDAAATSLHKVAAKINQDIMGAPAFLLVITSGGYAYRRKDGVFVSPLSCLAP